MQTAQKIRRTNWALAFLGATHWILLMLFLTFAYTPGQAGPTISLILLLIYSWGATCYSAELRKAVIKKDNALTLTAAAIKQLIGENKTPNDKLKP